MGQGRTSTIGNIDFSLGPRKRPCFLCSCWESVVNIFIHIAKVFTVGTKYYTAVLQQFARRQFSLTTSALIYLAIMLKRTLRSSHSGKKNVLKDCVVFSREKQLRDLFNTNKKNMGSQCIFDEIHFYTDDA